MPLSPAYQFPENFLWGVATASYQIEGAVDEDGRGPSIWDTFSHTPGKTFQGDTGDVACDHYHRYKEDAALIKSLGAKNYRFSIAWPRVIPTGDGAINPKGLAFYDRLVDELLANGITPWATMYHWDLPQALEDKGGWRARSTAEAFARYAETIVKHLGDRVKNWFTINEFTCVAEIGYSWGAHAPGAKEPRALVNQIAHHVLLAHAFGVRAVRQFGGPGARVGVAQNAVATIPVMEREDYVQAALKGWLWENARYLGPMYQVGYPAFWLEEMGADAPKPEPGDAELIAAETDFLGLNIYTGHFVEPADTPAGYRKLPFSPQYPKADMEWLKLCPQSLYWAVRAASECYHPKEIFITENGAGYADDACENGEVLDLHRRDCIRNNLVNLHRAAQEGYPIHGYFAWSLMDNFEWAEGYIKRFGLVHVDYATQKRTPKMSAKWYAEAIRQNRVV